MWKKVSLLLNLKNLLCWQLCEGTNSMHFDAQWEIILWFIRFMLDLKMLLYQICIILNVVVLIGEQNE